MRRPQERRVHGYTSPRTKVRPSAIDKFGLFTTRPVARGVVVAAWGGKILTKQELAKLPSTFRTNYALPVYKGFYLAETKPDELDSADFVNHSCEPNSVIKNLLVMVTKRNIKRGEELTADFDTGPGVGKKSRCRCGARNCRATVYF